MTLDRFGNHKNIAAFLRVMNDGAVSVKEMSEKTGISYDTVRPLMNVLHDEGVLYISHWKVDTLGRQSVAVYALGVGNDAPKRKPKTGAQRSMAYKVRQQLAQEREDFGAMGLVAQISNKTLDNALAGWR